MTDYTVSKSGIHNMKLVRCENLIAYKLMLVLVVHVASTIVAIVLIVLPCVRQKVSGLYCLKTIHYYTSSQKDVSPNVIPYVTAD